MKKTNLSILDIGIPINSPNFTEITDYLDNFPISNGGIGFGFRDYQIEFETEEEANEVIDYLHKKYNINFDNKNENDFYYSIYDENENENEINY